jgi:hypothetical protein
MNINSLRDKALTAGWVVVILFLICLLWILTQPVQKHHLLRAVNNVFIANNDSRRVIDHTGLHHGKAGLLGYWYSMTNSSEQMFVFAVFQDGILVPLGAVISPGGNVSEIIPLSAHAETVIDKMPASIIQIYITRIEKVAQANTGGRK